jgi:hypothetical protein
VKWEDEEKFAWSRAKDEKKIVMYFQLVGDLDKDGC